MFPGAIRRIVENVARLSERVSQLERQSATAIRDGQVVEVDAEKRRVRVRVGGSEDAPLITPWVPYAQHAGALKVHTPPSVGQQMTVITPNGDTRRARALPFTWWQENPSPSDSADENVLTFGNVRIEVRGDEVVVKVPRLLVEAGGTTFEVTAAGIEAVADAVQIEGETLKHNGIGIGFDHVHTEVERGGALSGPPPGD